MKTARAFVLILAIVLVIATMARSVSAATLYGVNEFLSQVAVIDTATGLPTYLGAYGDAQVRHLAFAPDGTAIPELPLPAAAWLMLTALGGMGLLGWRRKRTTA